MSHPDKSVPKKEKLFVLSSIAIPPEDKIIKVFRDSKDETMFYL